MTTNGPDVTLYADQQLPATGVTWLDADGTTINYATGWTFSAQLVDDLGYIRTTKTTGITGAATAPNVTISWASADLTALAGLYRLRLVATNGAGARRVFRPDSPPLVWVRPTPTAPPSA